MDRTWKPALAAGALLALACANPFDPKPPPVRDAADLATPPPDPVPAEDTPPPGGWIKDGVIYDKDGSVYGCVGGGNACAGPPVGVTDEVEKELDVCGNVDAIRDAELDYMDRHGSYKAAKATPRPVEKLDAHTAPWPETSGFADLGWSPGGPTRATYWVTVARESFEVHGLALVREGTWVHCFASDQQSAVDTPWRGP